MILAVRDEEGISGYQYVLINVVFVARVGGDGVEKSDIDNNVKRGEGQ